MTSKGVSALKFVGTISLGLLTGLSCSLSIVTIPSILALPSAESASRAFNNLVSTSSLQRHALTGISTASLLLAFFLSPRSYRHPYLVYTSILALTAGLSTQIAPFLLAPLASRDGDLDARRAAAAASIQARRERRAAREAARAASRMEASYDFLGANGSDAHSDEGTATASVSSEEEQQQRDAEEEERLNGEEVRYEVEGFRKTHYVQTAVSSLGFLMAVVGIWGDGAVQVFRA